MMNNLSENSVPVVSVYDIPRWYAAYTRPRHEKKVLENLQNIDIEAYVPLIKEYHQWCDRKKLVEVPLIRSYVFVHIPAKYALYVLETYGIVRFVMFQRELAAIPDFQIDALKSTVDGGLKLEPQEYLKTGQTVEVTDGPFKGIIGKIQRVENDDRFVISLDAIQTSYVVRVDPALLKPVSDDKKKARISLPLGM